MSKKTKRSILDGQAREFVIRLREYFEREREHGGPLISVDRVLDRVAAALEISQKTVSRISKEKFGETGLENNKLCTPKKFRNVEARVTGLHKLNVDAIRNHIHEYSERKEALTLKKLSKSLAEDKLFTGSLTSLSRLLKKTGFVFQIVNNKKVLVDNTDGVLNMCYVHVSSKKMKTTEIKQPSVT